MKRLFFAILLSISLTHANATLVTYNDYTLNTDTNIVLSGSMEWLQWDVTRGMSITTALNQFSADGWSLATGADMAGLFNDFGFNASRPWVDNENAIQRARDPFNLGDDITTDPEVQFTALFGFTREYWTSYHIYIDRELYSLALFGEDADGDGLYNRAMVHDDFYMDEAFEAGETFIDRDKFSATYSFGGMGVALVRSVAPTLADISANAVSAPASAGLLLLAMCAAVRRRYS